jgi:hypothetical protein
MGVAASIEGFTLCRTWELAVRCVCLTVDDGVSFVYSFGLGCIVWGKGCEIVVGPSCKATFTAGGQRMHSTPLDGHITVDNLISALI